MHTQQIRTWISKQAIPSEMESNTEPSQTQPDMSMTLEELLTRHTRGLEVPIFNGSYSDDEEEYFPDYKSLDLAERAELSERTQAFIDHTEDSLRKPLPSKDGEASKPKTSEGITDPTDNADAP